MADFDRIGALIRKIAIVHEDADLADILEKISFKSLRGPVRVAFVNAHAFNLCYKDAEFLNNILACDYIFRDGAGMKILYRLLGRDAGINMNGTDLIPRLLSRYRGRTIALMGTQPPYLDRAADKISAMGLHPVVRTHGFEEDAYYPEEILKNPADIVLLAMGMPKQERVAALLAAQGTPPCLIVCGGAILDFMGDKVRRAPDVFRRYGMEWLYRLSQEPLRLFKRYVIGNAVFLARAFGLSRHGVKAPNAPLRVLHVVRQYAPAIGGLESYVQNMARHQKPAGYDCEILTLNKVFHGDGAVLPPSETIEGVSVRRVSFLGFRRFFLPLISPFYFKKFDIVHVHNTDVFYDYVALVSALLGLRAVATTHGGFFHTKDFSLIKTLYFQTVTRFSSIFYKTVFAISQNDYDTFKPLTQNAVLMPNAIEPLGDEVFSGADVLYIGRLAEHKKVDRIIRVFAHVKKNQTMTGLLHIVGPEWDVTVDDLRGVARAAGIEDSVIFHGTVHQEKMKDIARSCGFFMSASQFEGFGMSMLEAMSVGLIPLVQDNESFHELVENAGAGLLTEYGDEEKAATEIAAFLPGVDDGQREKAQKFSRKFSWDELVQKTSGYYRDAFR